MLLGRAGSGGLVRLKGTGELAGFPIWQPTELVTAWYDAQDSRTVRQRIQSQLGVLDLTANGGINPYTGEAWRAGDTYRLAFVSSTTIDATSSDISVYNSHVQSAANAAGYGSVTWKAFVSTPTVNARDNTGLSATDADSSVWNFGDQIVGNNIADLFDVSGSSGGPQNKIQYDENGNGPGLSDLPTSVPFYQFTPAWTGSGQNGETENPVSGASVNGAICEAEKWFQWKRFTSSLTTEQTYLIAISEPLTVQGLGVVEQWDDKGPSGYHAPQATLSLQPGYRRRDLRLNSLPSVGYDQAKKWVQTPSFTARRVYVVTYYDDPDNTFDSFRTVVSDPDNFPRWQGASGSDYFQNGVTVGIANIYRNGDTTPLGVTESVLPMGPTLFMCEWDADYTNAWRLLAGLQTYHYWEYGALGEVIFTDGTETTAERQRIEGYLAWKWLIQGNLPVGHPYKNNAPMN